VAVIKYGTVGYFLDAKLCYLNRVSRTRLRTAVSSDREGDRRPPHFRFNHSDPFSRFPSNNEPTNKSINTLIVYIYIYCTHQKQQQQFYVLTARMETRTSANRPTLEALFFQVAEKKIIKVKASIIESTRPYTIPCKYIPIYYTPEEFR